jgi:hypothetical protein
MRQEYTEGGAGAVATLVESVGATAGVGGVFVLVGEAAAFTPGGGDTVGDDTTGGSAGGEAKTDPARWDVSVPVFGGVFPAVIHDGAETDRGTVVVGLPATPELQPVTGLDDTHVAIDAQLDPGVVDRGHETAFVLVDAYADRVEEFVDELFDTYGVEMTFVGGGAGRLDGPSGPSVFTHRGTISGGGVVASTTLESSVGVKHGWEAVAGPMRVTDAEGRTVHSLDGQPAFERYGEVVAEHAGASVDPESFFEFATAYPFGISRVGGETVVRDPYAVSDGSIDCFGAVPEGEFLHVLHGDRERLVTAARAARAAAVGDDTTPNDGGADDESTGSSSFVFDCVSRVRYLGEAFADELAAVVDGSTVGASTLGEIADGGGRLEYHNKTTVVASLTDR